MDLFSVGSDWCCLFGILFYFLRLWGQHLLNSALEREWQSDCGVSARQRREGPRPREAGGGSLHSARSQQVIISLEGRIGYWIEIGHETKLFDYFLLADF